MFEEISNIVKDYEKDVLNLDEQYITKLDTLYPNLKDNIKKASNISFLTYEYDVIEFYELLYEESKNFHWGQILNVVARDRLATEYKKVLKVEEQIARLLGGTTTNDILDVYMVVKTLSCMNCEAFKNYTTTICKVLERISNIRAKHKALQST